MDQKNNQARSTQLFESSLEDKEAREGFLFRALDVEAKGSILKSDILDVFERVGLFPNDQRLSETMAALKALPNNHPINFEEFCQIARRNLLLIERAIQGHLIIPDFEVFSAQITKIYHQTKENKSGDVARYIPQLARVDPEQYAVAVCSIDGQRFELGDSEVEFCVQSTCKPINYCVALETHGEEVIHQYIGREPSGQGFNELTLNKEGKPHNPMINAGAIMACSLIKPESTTADRFDYIMNRWNALIGSDKAHFSNSVYLSERQTADRNFALGYFMREHKAFPEDTDLLQTLEFYFQCCSIELTAQSMSIVAATLANGGVCPISGERVFSVKTVQHCLSLMYSCGMYDFSGEFAFSIGLPAKSGVAGALMIVVPNVMGICTWSPRLDSLGNSVRGIDFCKLLVETFNVHNYDNLRGLTLKADPRKSRIQAMASEVNELLLAASKGDLSAVQMLEARGTPLDRCDYDRRSALHLAASEGHLDLLAYFIKRGLDLNPIDRWGHSPLDEACRNKHSGAEALLAKHGARRIKDLQSANVEAKSAAGAIHSQTDIERRLELIWAASEGNILEIQRLVARGISLDGTDYDYRSALHLAASEGHEEVVKYFARQGIVLNPMDRFGGTPLDDAVREGHTAIANFLEDSLNAD
ncbi:MAG: glutaminase A [Planctomycetota bacterium]|nr:glutaminase A [Planctomycetota bacterium]